MTHPIIGAVVQSAGQVDPIDDNDAFEIVTDRGTLRFWHSQDCCESVNLEDITGEPASLVGGVVHLVEERESDLDESNGAQMWTFFEIRTSKGDITLRWNGTSNGYYSVSVSMDWLPKETP